MITRREFVKIGAASAAGAALFGGSLPAFADENPQFVEFTPELAVTIADNFASSAFPDKGLAVSSATPFYDDRDRLLGHIVTFEKNGAPHGYIILDMTCDRLISEFCFDEGAIGVHEHSMPKTRSASESHVVKIDPFRYAVVDNETREGTDNSGEEVVVPIPPSTRNDLDPYLLEVSYVFANYSMLEFGSIQEYCGFDESFTRSLDPYGRYQCTVTAAFTVASIYGACRAPLANDFRTIWNLVNPSDTGANIIGIRNAVTQFRSSRGKTVAGDYSSSKPDFSKIKGCINSNNVAALNVVLGSTKHSVTVEGYGVIVGSGLGETRMVVVYDEWNSGARFMYYDLSWSFMNSAFFNGR